MYQPPANYQGQAPAPAGFTTHTNPVHYQDSSAGVPSATAASQPAPQAYPTQTTPQYAQSEPQYSKSYATQQPSQPAVQQYQMQALQVAPQATPMQPAAQQQQPQLSAAFQAVSQPVQVQPWTSAPQQDTHTHAPSMQALPQPPATTMAPAQPAYAQPSGQWAQQQVTLAQPATQVVPPTSSPAPFMPNPVHQLPPALPRQLPPVAEYPSQSSNPQQQLPVGTAAPPPPVPTSGPHQSVAVSAEQQPGGVPLVYNPQTGLLHKAGEMVSLYCCLLPRGQVPEGFPAILHQCLLSIYYSSLCTLAWQCNKLRAPLTHCILRVSHNSDYCFAAVCYVTEQQHLIHGACSVTTANLSCQHARCCQDKPERAVCPAVRQRKSPRPPHMSQLQPPRIPPPTQDAPSTNAPAHQYQEDLDTGRFLQMREPGCLQLLCGGSSEAEPLWTIQDSDCTELLETISNWAAVMGLISQVRWRRGDVPTHGYDNTS